MEDGKEPVYASKAKPWLKYYEEKYIHQSVPECSAFALVCRNNERHLGDTALEYYGRKFSYADLIVQIKKTAAALQALGVKKGDSTSTLVSCIVPHVLSVVSSHLLRSSMTYQTHILKNLLTVFLHSRQGSIVSFHATPYACKRVG